MDSRDGSYHMPDLFQEGTIHHAAEIGSIKAVQQVQQQQKALRGLPAQVVLEQRDELLQVTAQALNQQRYFTRC